MNQRYVMQVFVFIIGLVVLTGAYGNIPASGKVIKVAILMPAPAKKIHKNWSPLVNYLSERLGRPVEIVTPRGLEQTKKALPNVDFVYANSYLYSLLKKDVVSVSPVAQMMNTSNSVYSRGRFLVRNSSPIKSVKDLKGKKIALISRYGAGAYLAPKAYLKKEGLDIDKDMDIEFTKNLKKAAYMVLLGKADTAVMCDVSYEILSKRIDTGDLRFFDKTDAFPEALIFTTRDADSEIVARFREALLEENVSRKSALKHLNGMKIGSFVPYDKVVENRIQQLNEEAGI